VLYNFFDALNKLRSDPRSVRVLHYGDSQIEGDRITDYLRMKLQGQFGGQGPGLLSLMPIAPSVTNRVEAGTGFDRYNVFTMKDKRVMHNNYGVLAGFTRFLPYRKISDSTEVASSEVKISTTKFGGANSTKYKKVRLFYGGAQARTWCEFYDGPALSGADSLEAGGILRVRDYQVGLGSLSHRFKFIGKDSPDLYAVSLESEQGIYVDNIALRGSSGTFYHQINFPQMKQFYDLLNVKLIILQFGGNALPSIKDPTMAVNYAGYLRGQIAILKKLAPGASIIFIGPADMSVKEGTAYVTHPQLENTRDAIRKVVLESGCAFFDMYDCMGGKNSMASWVDQKLAATDYIHFSPQGARKIATLFYSALISEYNSYLKNMQ
jgi:lysophospholipase L1-like esterase